MARLAWGKLDEKWSYRTTDRKYLHLAEVMLYYIGIIILRY